MTYDVPWLFATVNISEQLAKFTSLERLCSFESFHDICLESRFKFLFCFSIPPSLRFHEKSEPCDRIVNAFAVFHLGPSAICERIIGSRMMSDTYIRRLSVTLNFIRYIMLTGTSWLRPTQLDLVLDICALPLEQRPELRGYHYHPLERCLYHTLDRDSRCRPHKIVQYWEC